MTLPYRRRRRGVPDGFPETPAEWARFLNSPDAAMRREAERIAGRVPPPLPAPPPATIEELIRRLREDPRNPGHLAELLSQDWDDRKSWKAYHKRAYDRTPAELLDAYRRATKPGVECPGAVFMTALRR